MKRTLITLLLLAGCSAKMQDVGSTTLQPLPTSEIISETIPATDMAYTEEQSAFFDDVFFYYGSGTAMSDESLLEYGELWCQLMTDGMTDTDVVARINEGASDNDDARTHFSVVLAGIDNLCPSQVDKAEYIALNTPLP